MKQRTFPILAVLLLAAALSGCQSTAAGDSAGLFFLVKKCFDTRFRALPLLSVQTAKGFVRHLHRASVRCQTGE